MRQILVSLIILSVALIVFGSSSVPPGKAKGKPTVAPQIPGSRCTRLTFGPKEKKKPAAEAATAMPGTRCARLSSGGRPGTILPNTPPSVGLASSTAYISTNAVEKVNLKAISCDADGDNVLYTYSTTGGRIAGEGATAVWDLAGAQRPGTYTVSVEVDDGCGCISFEASTVTLE
jgi:hypothetical protein